MKKLFLVVLVFISFGYSTYREKVVRKMDTELNITVDGLVADNGYNNTLCTLAVTGGTNKLIDGMITNNADCSSVFYVSWNLDGFYVGCNFIDNIHSANNGNNINAEMDDCISIWIDKDFADCYEDSNPPHLGIYGTVFTTSLQTGNSSVYVRKNSGNIIKSKSELLTEGVDYNYKLINNAIYDFELKIKWTSSYLGLSEINGKSIGFVCAVSDNDGTGLEGKMFWTDRDPTDQARCWGKLIFYDPNPKILPKQNISLKKANKNKSTYDIMGRKISVKSNKRLIFPYYQFH